MIQLGGIRAQWPPFAQLIVVVLIAMALGSCGSQQPRFGKVRQTPPRPGLQVVNTLYRQAVYDAQRKIPVVLKPKTEWAPTPSKHSRFQVLGVPVLEGLSDCAKC